MSSHGNSLFLRDSGQRLGGAGWPGRLRDGLQQRALRTRLRLQTLTREHVLRFLRRHAFILLTVSAVVIGMASLDNKATGRMGMRAAVYYMVTTVIAVFIGILMVTIIHPGKGSKEGLRREGRIETIPTADAFMDLIR
nr:excitatory amino acid transporter 4-like [Microcebus murinus]